MSTAAVVRRWHEERWICENYIDGPFFNLRQDVQAVAVVEGYVVVLVVEGHAFFPSMMSSKYRGRIVSPRLSASRRTRRRLWRMIAGRSSMTRPSNVKD